MSRDHAASLVADPHALVTAVTFGGRLLPTAAEMGSDDHSHGSGASAGSPRVSLARRARSRSSAGSYAAAQAVQDLQSVIQPPATPSAYASYWAAAFGETLRLLARQAPTATAQSSRPRRDRRAGAAAYPVPQHALVQSFCAALSDSDSESSAVGALSSAISQSIDSLLSGLGESVNATGAVGGLGASLLKRLSGSGAADEDEQESPEAGGSGRRLSGAASSPDSSSNSIVTQSLCVPGRVWVSPAALASGTVALHSHQFSRPSHALRLWDRKEVLSVLGELGDEFKRGGDIFTGVDKRDSRLINRGFNPPETHAHAGWYATAFNVAVSTAGTVQTLHRADPAHASNHLFHTTCEGPQDDMPRRDRLGSLPLYEEVVILTHRHEWNVYHWVQESLAKAAPMLPYLLARPGVVLHVQKIAHAADRAAAGKFRERHLRLLGINWAGRVVSGPIRARVVHVVDMHACRFTYAPWMWLLRERLRAAAGHPATPFLTHAPSHNVDEIEGRGNSRKKAGKRGKSGKGRGKGGGKASPTPIASAAAARAPFDASADGAGGNGPSSGSSVGDDGGVTVSEDLDGEGAPLQPQPEEALELLEDLPSGEDGDGDGDGDEDGKHEAHSDAGAVDGAAAAAGGPGKGASPNRTLAHRHRIVVLRRRGEREIQNEEWLMKRLNALRELDITVIDDRAFPDQQAVFHAFATADGVVAAHGAGLTNALLSKPGACIIEIMPRAWFVPCYWRMNMVLGLRHNMFVTIGDKRSALNINVKRVVRALRECLAAQDASRRAEVQRLQLDAHPAQQQGAPRSGSAGSGVRVVPLPVDPRPR